MARRALIWGALLLAAVGCSEAPPQGTTQEALRAVRAGNYDQAIAAATTALKADPKDAEAHLYRGRAYHFRNRMGDPHLAIADFTQAIALAPESPDAYYSRALVYRDEGEKDLANADEEAARAADGQRRELYEHLPQPSAETVSVPPAEPVKPEKPVAKEPTPKSEAEERREFKRLQDRFEPAETPGATTELRRPQDRIREQVARDKAKQLDRNAAAAEPAAPAPAETMSPVPITPLETPQPTTGRTANGRAIPTGAPAAAVPRPAPTSPFQPRSVQPGMTSQIPGGFPPTTQSPFGGQTRSPFPQKRPNPTGYVEPPAQSPFGRQSRQIYNNPYSRPATTPSNSSDLIP